LKVSVWALTAAPRSERVQGQIGTVLDDMISRGRGRKGHGHMIGLKAIEHHGSKQTKHISAESKAHGFGAGRDVR
jgi:hypothetical protein